MPHHSPMVKKHWTVSLFTIIISLTKQGRGIENTLCCAFSLSMGLVEDALCICTTPQVHRFAKIPIRLNYLYRTRNSIAIHHACTEYDKPTQEKGPVGLWYENQYAKHSLLRSTTHCCKQKMAHSVASGKTVPVTGGEIDPGLIRVWLCDK